MKNFSNKVFLFKKTVNSNVSKIHSNNIILSSIFDKSVYSNNGFFENSILFLNKNVLNLSYNILNINYTNYKKNLIEDLLLANEYGLPI